MSPHLRTASILAVLLCPPAATFASPGEIHSWGSIGSGPGQIDTPIGVAASTDRVYVADFHNQRIQVFTREGTALASWTTHDTPAGSLDGPAAVAVGQGGSIFVADFYGRRIVKLTAGGDLAAQWPVRSSAAAAADGSPLGLAVDTDGNLYVTDLEQHRVHKYSGEGTLLRSWGGHGADAGELADPWGITIGADDRVYVADHGNDRIQAFTRDGEFVAAWGAGLDGPMGIVASGDGSLYVTDRTASRLRRFSADGTRLAEWTSETAGDRMGIAADGNDLFFTDATLHRIERIPATLLEATPLAPTTLVLARAWPNPGYGPVSMRFGVPAAGRLEVDIFGIDGRRIRRLPDDAPAAGERLLAWDGCTDSGRRAPPGIYLIHARFVGGGQSRTVESRVVLLR